MWLNKQTSVFMSNGAICSSKKIFIFYLIHCPKSDTRLEVPKVFLKQQWWRESHRLVSGEESRGRKVPNWCLERRAVAGK